MDSFGRSLFGDSLSLYNLWSGPWGVARLLGLHGHPPCPITEKGSRNNNKPEFVCSLLVEIFETQYMTMHMRKFLSVEALVNAQKNFGEIVILVLIKFSEVKIQFYFNLTS